VFLSTLWKPQNYSPHRKNLNFVVLLDPWCHVSLPCTCSIYYLLVGFIQVSQFYHAISENTSGGKNLDWDVNCSYVVGIMSASKGKGHKLVEMVCVLYLECCVVSI
jgi:hypothetical protein